MWCLRCQGEVIVDPNGTKFQRGREAHGASNIPHVAFVGLGGKSTALFYLALEYPSLVIITATSHLELFQARLADRHYQYDDSFGWDVNLPSELSGATLFSGPQSTRSVAGLKIIPTIENGHYGRTAFNRFCKCI